MRTSFHHQPEAQHPIFQLSTSWQADYPIFRGKADIDGTTLTESDLLRHALKQIRPSPSPPKARRQRRTTRPPRGHEPTAPNPSSCKPTAPSPLSCISSLSPARRDGE